MPHIWDPDSLSPGAALTRLIAGNRRSRDPASASAARPWCERLAKEAQRPYAIVLGCSDSRTPIEILFDEGFGDLFVVRIAGNIVAPSVVGSIEFAASQFGTRLVVVLGHTGCGAISATVNSVETGLGPESRNIQAIADRIAPALVSLVGRRAKDAPPGEESERRALLREAMRTNVRASVDHLRHGSRLMEELVLAGRVAVVGAEYGIETGEVCFFDGTSGLLDS